MPLFAQNNTSTDVVARPTFAQNYFTTTTTLSSKSTTSLSSSKSSSSSTSKSSTSALPNSGIDLKDSNTVILLAGSFIVLISIFLTLIKYNSNKVFENNLSKLDV